MLFSEEENSSTIRAIFLTGKSENLIPQGRPEMRGIQIMDLEVPGNVEMLKAILQPYLGRKFDVPTVVEVKEKILLYYQNQKNSFVGIEVPQQKTIGRTLQIVVSKKQFGVPIYKGETWYTDEQMNLYLGIAPRQDIVEDNLQNNLSWMNRNPFHYSVAKFIPGEEPGVIDLEVVTRTRRPIRLYGRADDTGSATTGYGRFASGFSWGNAFWVGDILTFEYGCSNEFPRYQSYMANYTSFLPWQHLLLVFGNYASVKPNIPDSSPGTDNSAQSAQLYLHYTIPLKPLYKAFKQELLFGLEYKNTNSNGVALTPSGVETILAPGPLERKTQIISQLYANYKFSNKMPHQNMNVSLDFYGSPGQWLPHQSNNTYDLMRKNSKNQYCYGFVTFSDLFTIPGIMNISLLLRGQISNSTLPSTELFNLGGYNTVRGYHEAELSTDNGFIGNLELRSLPISLWPKVGDQLIFLAFLDYAVGNNWFVPVIAGVDQTPPHTQYLLGVGPGLRYSINPYLQLRIDYGFKLHQLFTSDSAARQLRLGFGQFHLGLLLSY